MAYTSSKVGVDVGRRLQAASGQLARVQRPAVEKAALILTTSARAALPARMRNVGRSGAKVGARYDVKGQNNPTALVRATGPVHLLERDTSPHLIFRKNERAKGKGSSRSNRAQALAEVFGGTGAYRGGSLKFADGEFRKVVHHPGTKGQHLFGNAIERAMPAAKKALQSAASDAVIRGIKGAAR